MGWGRWKEKEEKKEKRERERDVFCSTVLES